jgi:hypothetical protein
MSYWIEARACREWMELRSMISPRERHDSKRSSEVEVTIRLGRNMMVGIHGFCETSWFYLVSQETWLGITRIAKGLAMRSNHLDLA